MVEEFRNSNYYKVINITFGFGAGGAVKTIQCKICRIKKIRQA